VWCIEIDDTYFFWTFDIESNWVALPL